MKNVHKKVLSFVSLRRFGNNPFISWMFQPLGQNQTFKVHARQMMHMLFETCARKELNKLELYVHAAGGKRFKFEDNPSFFSLSGCSATVHLLDQRHFHVLGVVVVGQIKVLGHGKTSSMGSGNCDYIPPQTEDAHQNGLWRDIITIPATMEVVFPWPSTLIWPTTTTPRT